MAANRHAQLTKKNPCNYSQTGFNCDFSDCDRSYPYAQSLVRHMMDFHKLGKVDSTRRVKRITGINDERFDGGKVLCPVVGCRLHFSLVTTFKLHLVRIHMMDENKAEDLVENIKSGDGQVEQVVEHESDGRTAETVVGYKQVASEKMDSQGRNGIL